MKNPLLFLLTLATLSVGSTTAFAQVTYTTFKDGNFNDLSIYTLSGGTSTVAPTSTSTVIIKNKVVLNTDFTLTTGSITIKDGGALRQDNVNRQLTINGSSAGVAQLIIEPTASRGLPQLQVGVLDLTKTTVDIGANGIMEIGCAAILRNQTTNKLSNNSLLNVMGNMDVETGNPTIVGPTNGGTPAGLRINGNIVGNVGGGSTLFSSSNTFITCVQGNTMPNGCTVITSTNIVTPPTSNDPNCFSVLPVTLTRFAGSRNLNNTVALSWATANELDNAYFGVERSADGKSFATLAQVAGAGNTSKAQTYAFTDDSPQTGAVYYRLRQTDFDGKATYSPVVYLPASGQAGDWLMATDAPRKFAVQGTLDANSRLMVLDAMGRTVYSQAVSPEQANVTLPGLPAGVYLFRLFTQQGHYTVRQILAGGSN